MKITVTTVQDISLQRISDLLCGAIEGGSNYWYMIKRFIPPYNFDFRVDPNQIYKHLDFPLNKGGQIIFVDLEANDQKEYTLSLPTIEIGLQVMANNYPIHFHDFLNENDDASTSDIFLQCCLFGKVIYG